MRTPSASRGVNARLSTQFVTAFRQGLKEAGFVEGQNVAIDYRWADNQLDRTPALVAELISRPVAVIVGNNATAFAAKAATKTVPIVFAYGSDPVQDGLVASLNRPGDNLTGVVFFAALGAKQLELLHRLVPNVTTIGLLVNPNTPETEAERKDVQAAAEAIGQQLIVVEVNSDRESSQPLQRSSNAEPALCSSARAVLTLLPGQTRRAGSPPCATDLLFRARICC